MYSPDKARIYKKDGMWWIHVPDPRKFGFLQLGFPPDDGPVSVSWDVALRAVLYYLACLGRIG